MQQRIIYPDQVQLIPRVLSANHTLDAHDYLIIFSASATLTLLPATGSGRPLVIKARDGVTVTILPDGSDTVPLNELYEGETLELFDSETGVWE